MVQDSSRVTSGTLPRRRKTSSTGGGPTVNRAYQTAGFLNNEHGRTKLPVDFPSFRFHIF